MKKLIKELFREETRIDPKFKETMQSLGLIVFKKMVVAFFVGMVVGLIIANLV